MRSLPVTGTSRHFKTGVSGWTLVKKFPGNVYVGRAHQHINDSFNKLTSLQTNYPSWDNDTRNNQVSNNLTQIKNNIKQNVAFSNTPFAEKFIEVSGIGPQQALSFWINTIQQPSSSANVNISDIASFQGAILAYEFKFQDESELTKRRDTEKRAVHSMRRILADKTDESIRLADELLKKMEEDSQAFKNALDEWKASIVSSLDEKLKLDQESHDALIGDGNSRLLVLEKLYADKLKLEKPAEYWNKQATKHQETGKKWARALICATALSGLVFISLFTQWISTGRPVEQLASLHWHGVILLGAVLSLSIFIIKTFSRLTFSSFHLQQDAEEREQLAYFYLALGHETNIEEESRKIVFQSLFSRAESGLLSSEHGPTMPIAEVAKYFGNKVK